VVISGAAEKLPALLTQRWQPSPHPYQFNSDR
jgi:hypothetical protein